MELSEVAIRVHTIVLRELPASRLLPDSDAVCFAAGADPEHRSDGELCTEVARVPCVTCSPSDDVSAGDRRCGHHSPTTRLDEGA
jgi:hypothetical protein